MANLGQNSSYSLYAIHLPILVIPVGILLPTGRQTIGFSSLLLVGGLCGLATAAGWLFSACTEWHTAAARRIMKRLVQTRRAASS
jgi:peptidoglycan/LPS O-acetylase OafA/YrhL